MGLVVIVVGGQLLAVHDCLAEMKLKDPINTILVEKFSCFPL